MRRASRATIATAITCLAVLPWSTMQAGAIAPPRDQAPASVIIVADSTGLSTDAWNTLRLTYANMVDDSARIPHDGSTAVSFVQYVNKGARQSSRVLVPLTVVDQTTAASISSILRQSTPITRTTPVAELSGVAAALAQAKKSPAGSRATVCTTTSSAWPRGAIAAAGKSLAAAGIAKASVLVVPSGGQGPLVAAQETSPLALGGGTSVGARSITQMAGLLASSCLAPQAKLEAIEVNQVIQNWRNEVPLVEYKATMARVFLKSPAFSTATVSGLLYGTRDGVPLSGSPLSPTNSGGEVAIDSDIANEADRANLDASLNFSLPTSWRSGDVELRFESTSSLSCGAAPVEAQDCAVDVSFLKADEPRITYASVPYSQDGTSYEPTSAQLVEQMYRTIDNFPIRYVDMGFDFLPSVSSSKPTLGDVNDLLSWYWMFHAVEDAPATWMFSDRREYGVMGGSGGGLASGIPGSVASGFLSGTGAEEAYGYGRNRGPHEQAHMYAAHHITNDAVNGTTTIEGTDYANGWCGEYSSTSAPDYSHSTVLSDGNAYPTLSALHDADTELWGLAPRFAGSNADLSVIDPYKVMPLLSYCGALDSSSQYRWPDEQTFSVLTKDFLGTSFAITEAAAPAPATDAKPGVLLRGIINLDRGAGTAKVSFPGALPFPSAASSREGDWRAIAYDATGRAIATLPFEIADSEEADPEESGRTDTSSATATFAVAFPEATARQIDRVEILQPMRDGAPRVAATITRSRVSPMVTINPVQQGAGSPTTISWRASDADSTELSTTVFYRPSKGAPWTPLAFDVAGSSVTIPADAIAGSGSGQFAVVTSDGLNWARSVSAPVAMPNHAPMLSFEQGDLTLTGAQNAAVSAFAYDVEDGRLGRSITWQLDKRTIGTGPELTLLGDQLRAGQHTLTATVRDGSKSQAEASVTLMIVRVPGENP